MQGCAIIATDEMGIWTSGRRSVVRRFADPYISSVGRLSPGLKLIFVAREGVMDSRYSATRPSISWLIFARRSIKPPVGGSSQGQGQGLGGRAARRETLFLL